MSIEVKIKLGHQCSKRVAPDGWHYHRCTRRATKKFENKRYCWQHDPARIQAQDALDAAQYKAMQEKRADDEKYRIQGRTFHDVLKEIAEGHNDPARLARSTLTAFEEVYDGTSTD